MPSPTLNIYRNCLSKPAFFSTVFYFPHVIIGPDKPENEQKLPLSLHETSHHSLIPPVMFNFQEVISIYESQGDRGLLFLIDGIL